MTKEELLREIKFLKKCRTYGADPKKATVTDDVILLESSRPDLFVIMDKKYNVFNIIRDSNVTTSLDKSLLASTANFIYHNKENITSDSSFSYPFQSYSIKDFIDLDNRVQIIPREDEQPDIRVNSISYLNDRSDYINLLIYAKFLRKEIENYFLYYYQMTLLDFEVPDVTTYIRTIMQKITDTINAYRTEGKEPLAVDILKAIGKTNDDIETTIEIREVSSMLFKNNTEEEKKSLEAKAHKLLKLLTVSEEDLRERELYPRLTTKTFTSVAAWLEVDPERIIRLQEKRKGD